MEVIKNNVTPRRSTSNPKGLDPSRAGVLRRARDLNTYPAVSFRFADRPTEGADDRLNFDVREGAN